MARGLSPRPRVHTRTAGPSIVCAWKPNTGGSIRRGKLNIKDLALIALAIFIVAAIYIGALIVTTPARGSLDPPALSKPPACHRVTAKTFNKRIRLLDAITGKRHHRASRPVCKHTIYRRLLHKIKKAKRQFCWHRGVKCWIIRAARRYHQPVADALRVAYCESSFDPHNSYAGHYGLFQFLPSTWATTPYRNRDIFSPRWNSMAAMWMWSVGRRGEWACQ